MRDGQFMKSVAFSFAMILCGLSVSATAQEKAEQQLLSRIDKSQRDLVSVQAKILAENTALSKKLNKLSVEVKELRIQGEKEQRKSDEKLLGLEELKKRLQDWELQSSYQQNILQSYATQFNQAFTPDQTKPELMAAALTQFAQNLEATFETRVVAQSLLSSTGSFDQVSVLRAGPVAFAVNATSGVSGPVVQDVNGEEKYLQEFSADTTEALLNLQTNGVGAVMFDPTLGNAQRLHQQDQSILQHLNLGGIWVLPILFFGCIALLIALLKAIQLLRLKNIDFTVLTQGDSSANSNALARIGEFQRKLCLVVMRTPVSQERDDLLVAGLMESKHKLESFMGVIAMSAAVAPLLGLLGTVSGMINTFKMMNIFGVSDAATVSGGISEALITTELGLIVAIPSIVVGALLNRRVKNYVQNLEVFAINISQLDVDANGRAQ